MRTRVRSQQNFSARRTAAAFGGMQAGGAAIMRCVHGATVTASAAHFHECSTYADFLMTVRGGDGASLEEFPDVEYCGFPELPGHGLVCYEALFEAPSRGRLVITPLRVIYANVDDATNPFGKFGDLYQSGGSVRVAQQLGYEGWIKELMRDRGRRLLSADPEISVKGQRRVLPKPVIERINAYTAFDAALALQT